MSYLDLPRIHLGGTFFTDPSTINNDPSHYEADVTRPSPWQNPKGLHRFKFVDVKVQAAIDANGIFVDRDPVLGVVANSTDRPSAAKIVDLDVYQQGVPTIFGFTLQISLSGDVNIVGSMDPCCCNGLWFQRVLPTRGWKPWDSYGHASFGGDTYASAVYQSVLRINPQTWPATLNGVLAQLREATTTDADGNLLLSIRMVLDSYNNVPWHDDYNLGRVVATLGPVLAGEAPHIPGGRWLDPRPIDPGKSPWYAPNFYSAPFKFIQRSSGMRLVIDLADAVCMQLPGGPPVPLGNLSAILGDGSTGQIGPFQVTQDLYQNLGGIIELAVTQTQWQAQFQPLSLITTRDDIGGWPVPQYSGMLALWREKPRGIVFDAIDQVFRLPGQPSTTATARVRVTEWGQPMVGYQPAVMAMPVEPTNQGASVPWSAGYTGDTPQAQGALEATVSAVDANGNCTVTLTVLADPGYRTSQLDGQLYFVVLYEPLIGPPPMNDVAPRQESLISCIVFSQYQAQPTWDTVNAIMTPYAKLYPGMTDQIDLTQQQAFFTFAVNPPWQAYDGPNMVPYVLPDGRQIAAGAIPYYMTRSFTDPRYMPVTRDLSPDKVLHVLTYCADLQELVQPTPPPPSGGAS
jgi:hypothetical protein